MEEENSNNMISRVVYPATQRGIHGLSMFTFIWMQITAPMKKEISRTIPMESTPNCVISFTYCFQNMRKRSGTLNVRPINIRYLPNVASAFIINIVCIDAICWQSYKKSSAKQRNLFLFLPRQSNFAILMAKLRIKCF